MDQQVLKLLRKYLDDRCTPQELEQVQTILQSDQYDKEWATVLEEDAQQSNNEDTSHTLDTERADQLLNQIVESAGIDKSKNNIQQSHRFWYAAASVLILIAAGISFLTVSSVFETGNTTSITTAAGEQKEVSLPDGSRVWLNDQSTLSYPEEFEGDTRNIQLEGRAFFDVVSDPAQPFLVQAEDLTVKVLGTSFDVSAYESDRDMTVTVASGRVSVSGETEDSPSEAQYVNTLQPGDRLTYDREDRRYLSQTMTFNDIRALREGQLVFQNRALTDIVQALERRYDITFQFQDASVKNKRLTFKPNSSDLNDVLQILSLVSGLEYERNGKEVVMREK